MIVEIYQTSVGTGLSAVITWLGLGFRGGAARTLVLVYVSIRLRETVSEFRPIERFSTAYTVQQQVCEGLIVHRAKYTWRRMARY